MHTELAKELQKRKLVKQATGCIPVSSGNKFHSFPLAGLLWLVKCINSQDTKREAKGAADEGGTHSCVSATEL